MPKRICTMLSFMGITLPKFVIAEGVAIGPDQREAAIASALSRIDLLQGDFAPAESRH